MRLAGRILPVYVLFCQCCLKSVYKQTILCVDYRLVRLDKHKEREEEAQVKLVYVLQEVLSNLRQTLRV